MLAVFMGLQHNFYLFNKASMRLIYKFLMLIIVLSMKHKFRLSIAPITTITP
ncbi:hypothetical protein ACZ87_00772 [Candidatus Erwinia dacicola]|uniref:Uncharacterized protein n=1 Tax=Candidatus Erwinia dacicola TaxID=252393 RepID=A0A328TP77_9GAMM|nr:hypothetical protein ACZ87_00772 [Candidatus Erwinia dacicola]